MKVVLSTNILQTTFMKNLLLTLTILSLGLVSYSQESTQKIPAKQSVELDYPELGLVRVELNNQSLKGLEISIKDKSTGKQISGFGLAAKGNAKIQVKENGLLLIENKSNKEATILLNVVQLDPKIIAERKGNSINFTLHNTSPRPIPLLIPSVMNPNLYPFSKSGVTLKIGQEILFKAKGKKYILLTVDDAIQKGDVLNVPKLLKARKIELGI